MASCPALNCTFLDQYENLYDGSQNLDYEYVPSPPIIVADPDIAGLGVFALILLGLCTSLNFLSGHSCVFVICLCHLDRGRYWLRLRIRR